MKLYDIVLTSSGAYSQLPLMVIEIETSHDPKLRTSCDMGRYTLQAQDGTTYRNMPGYLLRLAPKKKS